MPTPRITCAHVEAAAQCLADVAFRTPVCTSSTFDDRFGARFFFKCENFQRSGAFKFRGAYNALSRLSQAERRRGVLTVSSGNHAQALALAGRMLGIPIVAVMPSDAPPVKRNAVRGYGAEIISFDPGQTTREHKAAEISKERDLILIPPYDHPHVVAGQGTVVRELIQEVGDLDLLIIGCGGGGLLAGSAIVAEALLPNCRVVGVEPAHADDAVRSFRSGILHSVQNPNTVADGARTPSLGGITFPLILEHVDDMVTVREEAIMRAMHFFWQRMKLVVEPTGALAAAALFDEAIPNLPKRVGVVISGGNVGIAFAAQLFQDLHLE